MELQSILDRFEFRPDPETTLTHSVEDLRGAVRVIGEDLGKDGEAIRSAELESALRTSRERIETCHGIIAAHGFAGPIVEGASGLTDADLDWADIGSVVGIEDSGQPFPDVFATVPTRSETAVVSRIENDRLELMGTVSQLLPDPDDAPHTATDLEAAFLSVAAVAYFLSGFGTHPHDLTPDADRVFGGYWLLAAVITGIGAD